MPTRASNGTVTIDSAELADLLRGSEGPVFKAMVRAGDAVKTEAKRRVGVDTGRLRDSIVKRVERRGDNVVVIVTAEEPYAVFHHEGTPPHKIRPVRAKVLSFVWNGDRVFFAEVDHPGTRPNRFLSDALGAVRRGL